MRQASGGANLTVSDANSVWVASRYALQPAYRQALDKYFKAQVETITTAQVCVSAVMVVWGGVGGGGTRCVMAGVRASFGKMPVSGQVFQGPGGSHHHSTGVHGQLWKRLLSTVCSSQVGSPPGFAH